MAESEKVGYLAEDGGLEGSGFDANYVRKWESSPGATDIQNVMPEVKAAFNGIAKAACSATGGQLLLTGGAEKGYHQPGAYGHEGGWKLDVDPQSVENNCKRDAFLELCEKYGCAVGDEEDHYDLAFNSQGGVGGVEVATPQKFLSDGGGTNATVDSKGKPRPGKKNDSQYAGFRFKYIGTETVQITKLPKGKTYCEPIYPDLVMIGDSVPKWALDAAATVTNVTDASMIQWGKADNKTPAAPAEQHPEEETPLQKEYDKFGETFNKYKKDAFERWKKANGDKGTEEDYKKAAAEHPEQFESGIYVGSDESERNKAKELVNKEWDYEKKLEEEKKKK